MHKFRIYLPTNTNAAWLVIDEGNINIESGIRFIYSFLDYNEQTLNRNLFIINGDDFASIGMSGKDTRIAIVELLLDASGAILVKE